MDWRDSKVCEGHLVSYGDPHWIPMTPYDSFRPARCDPARRICRAKAEFGPEKQNNKNEKKKNTLQDRNFR